MRIALCSYSQKEKETALLMKLGKVDRFDNGVFCVYAMQRMGLMTLWWSWRTEPGG